ncbi:MAG: SDR family NAD(P)-dependent oxidoreductase, partial [Proteobacteria bacterium]|nr:SDR family NAD(P)-dependent oxidoreductase [Pseudomonadota bacterium]
MADSFSLSGKIALVTGASGGLGRHFANVLAGAGATVAVGARRMDKVTETVAGIESAGGRAFGVAMDVTDKGGVTRAFDLIEEQAGLVTVLVNNAGVTGGRPALDVTEEDWDRVMDTNLKGAWTVAQEAARRM